MITPSSPFSPGARRPRRRMAAVAAVGAILTVAALVAPPAALAAPVGQTVSAAASTSPLVPDSEVVKGYYADGTRVHLTLDKGVLPSMGRYILTVDGAYVAETYNGTVYYGWANAYWYTTIVAIAPDIRPGSVVEVRRASGTPGQSWSNATTIYRTINSPVRQVKASGTTVSLTLDEAVTTSPTRIIVDVNGAYAMELKSGTAYAGALRTDREWAYLSRTLPALPAGARVNVYAVPGSPGGSRAGQVLMSSTTL